MNDSEKPFACNIVGCNMSFVNEDHLTVHKKKHDMILNLGINNKTNFFIVDQTPTPTRFIRSCDEVGLFQDLQNENPFEETFRKAVEHGKHEFLAAREINGIDDTLQTPSVFPQIKDECKSSVIATSTRNQNKKSDVKSFTETATIIQKVSSKEIIVEDYVKDKEEPCKINFNTSSKDNITVQILSGSSLDSTVLKTQTYLPASGVEMQFIIKAHNGNLLKLVAAPMVEGPEATAVSQIDKNIIKQKCVSSICNKSNQRIIQIQKLQRAKMKLKQALIKDGIVTGSKPCNENEAIETSKQKISCTSDLTKKKVRKKEATLERNRASSMRARAKRKAWIEQLQQSLKISIETNTSLHIQLKTLHTQVAKLKTLLLAHKDCPITKAMEKGNGIILGSKVITVKPSEKKCIQVITELPKPMKRLSSEKLILPKEKSMILSTVKNSVILPRIKSNSTIITLHAAETVQSTSSISIAAPVAVNIENRQTAMEFLHTNSDKVSLV